MAVPSPHDDFSIGVRCPSLEKRVRRKERGTKVKVGLISLITDRMTNEALCHLDSRELKSKDPSIVVIHNCHIASLPDNEDLSLLGRGRRSKDF